MIERYKKKPVSVSVCEYTGTNEDEILKWCKTSFMENASLFIKTLEGKMHVSKGDFVIEGVQGEFYPCKPDIFAQTYEPANKERSYLDDLIFMHGRKP